MKEPQDRKPKTAVIEAQEAEAGTLPDVVNFDYKGENFSLSRNALTFRVQREFENRLIATGMERWLGAEQFEKILDWPLSELDGFQQVAVEAAGLGNSVTSATS